jgi:hypothetical protein
MTIVATSTYSTRLSNAYSFWIDFQTNRKLKLTSHIFFVIDQFKIIIQSQFINIMMIKTLR